MISSAIPVILRDLRYLLIMISIRNDCNLISINGIDNSMCSINSSFFF